eukprot:471697-Pleurochrysis_carterae.AAC.3
MRGGEERQRRRVRANHWTAAHAPYRGERRDAGNKTKGKNSNLLEKRGTTDWDPYRRLWIPYCFATVWR